MKAFTTHRILSFKCKNGVLWPIDSKSHFEHIHRNVMTFALYLLLVKNIFLVKKTADLQRKSYALEHILRPV